MVDEDRRMKQSKAKSIEQLVTLIDLRLPRNVVFVYSHVF